MVGYIGAYSSGSGVTPPPEKLQRTSNTIVLPLIFWIWFGVFPIGTAHRPNQLQSATRRPDCAWTVGIASVGTESVGIVWCTLYGHGDAVVTGIFCYILKKTASNLFNVV